MKCWLEHCPDEAIVHKTAGVCEIRLCDKHGLELEATAKQGYSLAEPPNPFYHRGWWPWRVVNAT